MTKKELQTKHIEYLKGTIKPFEKIFCYYGHHNASSGTGRIATFKRTSTGITNISYQVAIVAGYKWNRQDNAVVVPGYGFSKSQAVVDALSYKLFGNDNSLECVDL